MMFTIELEDRRKQNLGKRLTMISINLLDDEFRPHKKEWINICIKYMTDEVRLHKANIIYPPMRHFMLIKRDVRNNFS